MSDVLVEALVAFNYSPNGWDNTRSIIGEEIYLSQGAVDGLLELDPPFVKLIDEDFKPVVFSTNEELIEKQMEVEELPELPIESMIEENVEVESVGEKAAYALEDLEYMVDEAEKGADVIDLGIMFEAKQKSGSWYNVIKRDGEELVNDTGISRKNLAKYVYDLYLEEA